MCKICQDNDRIVLDDEFHFVMHCPAFVELRTLYLEPHINEPSYDNFIVLLTEENAEIQKNVAAYIYHASKLRNQLLIV